MENSIYVKGIEVYAYHGVFPEENNLGQKFIFDIECSLDFRKAMLNDDLEESVSYGEISKLVTDVASQNTYKLLERLGYEIIKEIFSRYARIHNVRLTINKPNAPIKEIITSCGVVIDLSREEMRNFV